MGQRFSRNNNSNSTNQVTPQVSNDLRLLTTSNNPVKFSVYRSENFITQIDCSSNGIHFVCSFQNDSIQIYHLDELKQVGRNMKGNQYGIYNLKYSNSGSSIASLAFDKTLNIWNSESQELLSIIQVHDHSILLDFSPNDQFILFGGLSQNFLIHHLQNPSIKISFKVVHNCYNRVISAEYSSDGKYFCLVDYNGCIKLQNSQRINANQVKLHFRSLIHSSNISTARLSKTGKLISVASSNKRIYLWSLIPGKKIRNYHTGKYVQQVEFIPCQQLIAYSTTNDFSTTENKVFIWDISRGQNLGLIASHYGSVWSFSGLTQFKLAPSGLDIITIGGIKLMITRIVTGHV